MPMQSGSERRLAKKKRKLVLAGKGDKTDYFDVYGPEAKAEVIWKVPEWHPGLRLQDFQGLITWILAEGMNPKWIFIKNKPLVPKVVLLFLPGLDAAFYTLHLKLLQNLEICCGSPKAVRAITNAASPIEVLLTCPLRKQKMEHDKIKMVEAYRTDADEEEQLEKIRSSSAEHTQPRNRDTDSPSAHQRAVSRPKVDAPGLGPVCTADHYLLTEAEMHENGYPIAKISRDGCSAQLPEGFVVTRARTGQSHPDMVAIDCEMCYTATGLELARVSLVNSDGKILYDSLVKPTNPITNYNTRYSGITAKMMEGVTTTLKGVQEKLLEIIHEHMIIVGHSLEFDLRALELVHMKVIDTALLYRYARNGSRSKPALRVLASRYLDRRIQDQFSGHDSVEDARAAMDLAVMRINAGPLLAGEKVSRQESLMSVLSKHGRRCSMLDRNAMLRQFADGSCNAITCQSDDDVVAKAAREVKKENVDFVWVQLMELNAHRNWPSPNSGCSARTISSETAEVKSDTEIEQTVDVRTSLNIEHVTKKLNTRVQILYDALPPNSMLIVLTSSAARPCAEVDMSETNADIRTTGLKNQSCASVLETLRRPNTALGFVTSKI